MKLAKIAIFWAIQLQIIQKPDVLRKFGGQIRIQRTKLRRKSLLHLKKKNLAGLCNSI